MSRYGLFVVILFVISVLIAGCGTREIADKSKAVEIVEEKVKSTDEAKSEVIKKDIPEPPKESVDVEKKDEPSTPAEDVWIIPRDESLPARFFSDLANIYSRYRRMDMAQQLFQEAIAREKNDESKSSYYTEMAKMYSKNREHESAAGCYEKAIELTKSDNIKLKHYKELAKLYSQLKNYAKASESYEFLYKHEKDDKKKLRLKRQMYTMYNQSGKIDEVKAPFETTLKENPDSVEALEELAFINAHILRKPNEAIPYMRKLADIFPAPDNRKYLNQLSIIYRQLNMTEEHAKVILEIVEQLPENQHESYMLTVARIYTDGGNSKKAIEFADKVIARNPDKAYTYLQVATIYMRNGSEKRADELFEKSMELSKDARSKQTMLFQYAIANIKEKDYAKADKLFEEQEKLIKEEALEQPFYEAVTYEFSAAEQTDLVEKWLRKHIEVDPTNSHTYLNLSRFLWKNKREDEAQEIIKSGIDAVETPENKINLLAMYYNAQKRQKEITEARKTLEQIQKYSPDDKNVLKWVESQKKLLDKLEAEKGKSE